MLKILKLTFFFCFAALYSQSVSDYAFVYVAGKTGDLPSSKYGLATHLSSKLADRKYVIINENNDSWPEVAKNNPCGVLKAEIQDTSTFFKNKIQINLKDCSGKDIASFEGSSNIKEFEPGFKEAMNNALKIFPISNPVKSAVNTQTETSKQTEVPVSEPVKTTSLKTPNNTVQTGNKAEIFSNGTLNLNRMIISNSQFIFANPNNSTPFAVFNESTKKEVYRVKLQNGSQTLGYVENGSIVIELLNEDGTYRKEVFERK